MITTDNTLWSTIRQHVVTNAITYPIEYVKILIQIGHEPISPQPTTTLFGKPALGLPNVFQYVKHIKKVDGLVGCYRGFVPKLCACTVGAITLDKTCSKLTCIYKKRQDKRRSEDDAEDDESSTNHIFEFLIDLISRTTAIIVSYPLEVIALRMLAQFVGRETKYNGIFTSFVEVYRENGVMGYFAGIVPRLIGNTIVLVMISSSTYAVKKYMPASTIDIEFKPIICSIIQFIVATITYPFLVVSHCMAVNNCGLAAGLPPHMPIYNSWQDCWFHLSATNQLNRGNSLLWRYYTGPSVIINGMMVPK
ncbi:mitochondrial carrier homolog 2 [Colletes latitarsis]|uniref:mitochondrial carrier homolog 2 n=1 Tax=Colletes latitarsis TaxID=2605962 RepID=UPI00403506DB